MNIEKQYLELLEDILKNGIVKKDRTGTGTISLFGRMLRHNMSEGFPLITTKKIYFKAIAIELLWFLGMMPEEYKELGETNIKFLIDNNVNIWNDWPYAEYKKRASKIEEPDYDIHVDDPEQNCVRIMTQDEFVQRIKTDWKFAKRWGSIGPGYGHQWRHWNEESEDELYENYLKDISE